MLKLTQLFLFFCLVFVGCKADFAKQINSAELALAKQYSPENARKLTLLYQKAFFEKDSTTLPLGDYVLKGVNLCMDSLKDYTNAIALIKSGYEKAKLTEPQQMAVTSALLQMHHDILRQRSPGYELDSLSKNYITATLAGQLPLIEKSLAAAKAEMVEGSTLKLTGSHNVYRFAIIAESLAALVSNTDPTRTCNLLFEAANASRAVGNYLEATKLYGFSSSRCKDQDRAATSLFLMAFTFENDVKDLEEARNCYNKFLVQFPNHEMAQSAKLSIQNLGIPAEELLERLKVK